MYVSPVRSVHRSTGASQGLRRWTAASAVAVAMLALAAPCDYSQSQNSQNGSPSPANPQPTASLAGLLAARARVAETNVTKMNDAGIQQANFEAANLERRRQITEDSAQLLKLATELKAEIEKTSKDTLSLAVIRKAEEIERLAHNVQLKMKLTVNAN